MLVMKGKQEGKENCGKNKKTTRNSIIYSIPSLSILYFLKQLKITLKKPAKTYIPNIQIKHIYFGIFILYIFC